MVRLAETAPRRSMIRRSNIWCWTMATPMKIGKKLRESRIKNCIQ